MSQTKVIEKVKCHFCHKRGYVDPNKPNAAQGWHIHFWGPVDSAEYWICSRCNLKGKIRCPDCSKEAQKVWTGITYDETGEAYDDYEIHCEHCQSVF